MSNELKKYELLVEANSFDGSQTFACMAESEEDALNKFKNGLCEIIEVNVEVIGLEKLPFDVFEVDDISSRLPNNEIAALTEHNRLLNLECNQLKADKAELVEALGLLSITVTNVQLKGNKHIPSMRDRQSAMLRAKGLLNKHKGE